MNFSDEPCANLTSKSTMVFFIKQNLTEVKIDFNTNFSKLVPLFTIIKFNFRRKVKKRLREKFKSIDFGLKNTAEQGSRNLVVLEPKQYCLIC